jgi:metal-responsive CopG/Arc/MetJ family transcriptional regulator
MGSVVRISIQLPAEILRIADRERRSTGETRSELFRRALEEMVARRERAEIDRYVAGYLAKPEDAEDGWVDALGRERVEQEPWV